MFSKNNGHLSWCPTLAEPCLCKTSGYVLVSILAMGVAMLEFWGSYKSKSLSLLGDAWHVASDIVVYMIAIWANIASIRNEERSLEIKRTWAVRNANVLMLVAFSTIIMSLWKAFHQTEIVTDIMLLVALLGFVVNVFMYFVLNKLKIEHEHGKEHTHDHLHDTTLQHTIMDTGISMAVILTAGLIKLFPFLMYLRIDSLVSIGICSLLIAIARKTRRRALGGKVLDFYHWY